MSTCPCGGLDYDSCCGPFHRGANAPTAEKLMRSRFSAFARKETGYLLRTWHPSTRPRSLRLDAAQTWDRLEIVGTHAGGLLDTEGRVEFFAHGTERGRPHTMHEHSTFTKVDRAWLYVAALPT
jgi:SEC-C motif-containing protein